MAKSSTPYTQAGQALQRQADNSPGEQLNRHKLFLEARMAQLTKWVRQGVAPEALVRFTLMDMSKTPKLRECTPQSIYLGLLACAVTGLEPGALKGEAYLVPFKNNRAGVTEATFIPGWRGLVKQARRSREVIGIVANVVRAADVFDIDLGTDNRIVHRPVLGAEDAGDVIGAYAIATLANGHREIEWMGRPDLDKIRAIGERKGSDAWKEWPDQMARKSPIRRLAKRLPLGSDYYVALALEQATDEDRSQVEVLDIETGGEATRSTDQAGAAPKSYEEQEAEEAERALSAKENADG